MITQCATRRWSSIICCASLAVAWASCAAEPEFKRDDEHGELKVLLGGKEALSYQYGKDLDMAHYYPVRSPSGKLLTIQKEEH